MLCLNVKYVIISIAITITAVAAVFWLDGRFSGDARPAAPDAPAAAQAAAPAGEVEEFAMVKKVQRKRRTPGAKAQRGSRRPAAAIDPAAFAEDGDDDDVPPEERKRLDAIEEALDHDDFKALAALAAEIQNSAGAEVRSEYVDALGVFGEKALIELLPFMADPDADIAENARDQWTMALSEVENEQKKCKYIESAMRILTDSDTLDTMMTELNDCDDRIAVQTIVDILASGTKQAVAAAKEQYEFVTGEEYVDFATAEKWLRENYVPDEAAD